MRFSAIHVVLLGLLPEFSTAQGAASTQNPLTIPPCETLLSIVESCESKLIDDNTITASVSSCLCHDGSGNYAPTIYDNAVAGCSSALPEDSTDFGFWIPGLCTGALATGTGAASTTTVVSTTNPLSGFTGLGTVTVTNGSPTPTLNPGGGHISTTTSNQTSTSSASSSTTAGAAGGHVSTTSSKAGGVQIGQIAGDASIWSILGSMLGAILML